MIWLLALGTLAIGGMLGFAVTIEGEDDGRHRKTNSQIPLGSVGERCASGDGAQGYSSYAAIDPGAASGSVTRFATYSGSGRAMSVNNVTAQQMADIHRVLMNKMAQPPPSNLMQQYMAGAATTDGSANESRNDGQPTASRV